MVGGQNPSLLIKRRGDTSNYTNYKVQTTPGKVLKLNYINYKIQEKCAKVLTANSGEDYMVIQI